MEKKEHLYFEFIETFLEVSFPITAAERAHLVATVLESEWTEVVVKPTKKAQSRRQITHSRALNLGDLDSEQRYIAILTFQEYESKCQEADAEYKEEQETMIAHDKALIAANRSFALDSVPINIRNKISESELGCWLWTGSRTSEGYGILQVNGRRALAHRYIYELLADKIPPKKMLRHQCHTSRCVNPSHLFPGTAKQNHDDMVAAKRSMQQLQQKDAEKWITDTFPTLTCGDIEKLPHTLRAKFNVHEDCWLWIGNTGPDGPETIRWHGKNVRPRNLIFQKLVGKIPRYVVLNSKCQSNSCVNPKHAVPVMSKTQPWGSRH